GAPGPDAVPPDRAAQLTAVVLVQVDAVALAGDATERGLQVVGQVVGLHPFVLVVDAGRTARRVAAALEHEVQADPRRRGLQIGPARHDVHLLEHVDVVVGRRGPQRRHVGDGNTVDAPGVVTRGSALGLVVRLLAGL